MGTTITDLDIELRTKIRIKYLESKLLKVDDHMYNK